MEHAYNGLLCEVKNSASLMQAMQKLMAMTEQERLRIGENGRILVSQNYGEHLVIEATMRSIESIIQSE